MIDLLVWLGAWMAFSVLIAALPALVESLSFARLSSGVRRGAWFLLALRAALPLGLVPLILVPPLVVGFASPVPAEILPVIPGPTTAAGAVMGLASGVDWEWLFLAVYALGLATVWALQSSARRAWKRALETRRQPSPRVDRIAHDQRLRLRIGKGPQVVVVPTVPSPCLVGLLCPRLVLPDETRFTDAELTWMIRHELEHYRAGDLWLTAVVRGLHLVLWFLPGLWWISARFCVAAEEACDDRVLALSDHSARQDYALTLMKFLQPAWPSVTAMATPLRRLKHRFLLIRHPSQTSIPALVLLVLVVVGSGAWGAAGGPLPPSARLGVPGTALASLSAGWPFAPGTPCWVTSVFGVIENPFTKEPYVHQGIDLAARTNTPVHTIWAGTVTQTGFDADQGYFLKIDLGEGWSTVASHLAAAPLVSTGARVEAGQVVALVGSTGLSTGPHLHLEVWKDGVAVDPVPYLTATP